MHLTCSVISVPQLYLRRWENAALIVFTLEGFKRYQLSRLAELLVYYLFKGFQQRVDFAESIN